MLTLGCVLLQPGLLEELHNGKFDVPVKLNADEAQAKDIPRKKYLDNEPLFRLDLNEDPMAVDKLREGISKFAVDAITLKGILKQKVNA